MAQAHHEIKFEELLVADLCTKGWDEGSHDGYDKATGLYTQDLLTYIQNTQPDAYTKFQARYKHQCDAIIVKEVVKSLDNKGTLHTLRNEIAVFPARLKVAQVAHPDLSNPTLQAKYDANICRVVRQVYYSQHHKNSIDVVLFINGIPVSTLELKTDFTQSVEDAIHQYKNDRLPKDPKTRHVEPLLSFNRGALVHFAVSTQEVFMTTKLEGTQTFFLPFNRGYDGGKGNPPVENGYATEYLWKDILEKHSFLNILAKFIQHEIKFSENHLGKHTKKEVLIFPRYHQLRAVRSILSTIRHEGVGHKYLIQHSAGSGKSNSIAWLAHQLRSLHDHQGKRIFDTVIVIVDRQVLDDQLSDTIASFEHKDGVVVSIDRDNSDFKSKSHQLEHALINGASIITVTIQTFPHVLDSIKAKTSLKERNFAIIADEAHSSQSGATAASTREVLSSKMDDSDGQEVSAEDLLNETMTNRAQMNNLSFFAFTATPKQKTMELFGRPANPDMPISADNQPRPFDVYSMKQAIEEKFILDVLQNYTTYKMACRLETKSGDLEVDSRQAKIKLKKYIRLHPTNIAQKIDIIISHFNQAIQKLLNGQAKAMVVTASRQQAVRYKIEFDKYIQKHRLNIQAMVAFSQTVLDDYEGSPKEYTERNMNPTLHGRDMRQAFDTDDYQVMLVANKFQTGFDQPKLCAMYVDKKLSGVDAVQTLSRLNRTYPGKTHVFVLDFVNEAEDIQEAFSPYYEDATVADVTDPNVIYELYEKIDEYALFTEDEVNKYVNAYLSKRNEQNIMSSAIKPAVDRFKMQFHQITRAIKEARLSLDNAKKSGIQAHIENAESELSMAKEAKNNLEIFKKNLASFIRTYDFLSQIINYDDVEIEKAVLYAKGLLPNIHLSEVDTPVEIDDITMTHYRLTRQDQVSIDLAASKIEPIKPGQAKARDSKTDFLAKLIEQMNELFAGEFTSGDFLNYFNGIVTKVEEDELTMSQVRNNTKERALEGNLKSAVTNAIVLSMDSNTNLTEQTLREGYILDAMVKLVADRLYQNIQGK